jgi:hypothetical protein
LTTPSELGFYMNKKVTVVIIICLWNNEYVRVKLTWLACIAVSIRAILWDTTYSSDCDDEFSLQAETSFIWPRSYVFASFWRRKERRSNTTNASCVLKQKAVDILFRFLRTSTGNCDFDFVMLSFSFLAPNGEELNCEFRWVVHLNTDNCSEQEVHSVMRFVHRRTALRIKKCAFKCRSMLQKRRCRSHQQRWSSTVHVAISCSFCWLLLLYLLFCFVCFRSRSYPVPHRGERVKQRTVHARNWNDCYSDWKVLHFTYLPYACGYISSGQAWATRVLDVSDQSATNPLLFPPCSYVGHLQILI